MDRTVEIKLSRKRVIYETAFATVTISDADALAVRAYDGQPKDHDYAYAAEEALGPFPDVTWDVEGEVEESLAPELSEIIPSLQSVPPAEPI